MLRTVLLLAGLGLVACGERSVVEVPVTHPAHADATEAPVPVASSTLALPANTHEPAGFDVPRHQIDEPRTHADPTPSGAGEHQAEPAGSGAGPAHDHAEPVDGAHHDQEAHQEHAGADAGHGATPDAGTWTCPMHPEVLSDQAGRCPTCNMKLVPKKDQSKTGDKP
ncbi:MAG: hypothetical protein H0W83_02140 [Planctomycetes bacterium]|nr:hypothetical protein [Planctomycetota bacterium]